jgi:hypothetical protein
MEKMVLRLTLLKHLGSRVERQVPYRIRNEGNANGSHSDISFFVRLSSHTPQQYSRKRTHVLVEFMLPETLIVPSIALPQGVHVPQEFLVSGSFDDGLSTSQHIIVVVVGSDGSTKRTE